MDGFLIVLCICMAGCAKGVGGGGRGESREIGV